MLIFSLFSSLRALLAFLDPNQGTTIHNTVLRSRNRDGTCTSCLVPFFSCWVLFTFCIVKKPCRTVINDLYSSRFIINFPSTDLTEAVSWWWARGRELAPLYDGRPRAPGQSAQGSREMGPVQVSSGPCILWHSGIWGAADKQCWIKHWKIYKIPLLKLIFAFFERMRAAKIFISTARGSTRLHSQLFSSPICDRSHNSTISFILTWVTNAS